MKNHPKQVQNDCYDNFSKIRTKTAVFKNYVTLLDLSFGAKRLRRKLKGVRVCGLKTL